MDFELHYWIVINGPVFGERLTHSVQDVHTCYSRGSVWREPSHEHQVKWPAPVTQTGWCVVHRQQN